MACLVGVHVEANSLNLRQAPPTAATQRPNSFGSQDSLLHNCLSNRPVAAQSTQHTAQQSTQAGPDTQSLMMISLYLAAVVTSKRWHGCTHRGQGCDKRTINYVQHCHKRARQCTPAAALLCAPRHTNRQCISPNRLLSMCASITHVRAWCADWWIAALSTQTAIQTP